MESQPSASDLFAKVDSPSTEARQAAIAHQADLTKPVGALGRYEEIGIWIASCQNQCPPRPISRPTIVVFAGDHGIATHGVSAYPSEVSIQMAENIRHGGAAINVLGRAAGAEVRLVDVSLDHDVWGDERVSRSCGSIDREDAMSNEQVVRALEIGRRIADEECDRGADLLIAGDLGIGNTTPAAALIGLATRLEPVVVVGRGTGIDDEGWKRKVAAVRDAMFRARLLNREPVSVLRTIGSPDLAAMAGFLAQAAVRRTPVILDGVVVSAAALWANRLAPGARQWWIAGHRSVEPAHSAALEALDLTPILDFGMRLGEGSGAAAALPIVTAAVDIMADMATFSSAGVSTKSEGESVG
ncbi:Nicotinate-nucleotide--dimethylbenzimidazole phosphoribosyltransferase [Corynebacterium ciconiae DSM 44920]|uniref:nicotinate-nucleotide--dimethylbenzimidazole phosphoribosyltransferase n=1 Tax=Corynebacterium ciconiae TaxID=227319 RepID=UPI00036A91E9|nr:nicotinate-nucleotide--dimethylbenzimidazole phosphoribosyltransferase [Corynebacterium ciconiae]WKD60749.1 Nicotinate-nucleotide--dimethylbenzimidazole phosphoribosyltransferase [Corynebacterium ciconiae DSM 44920]